MRRRTYRPAFTLIEMLVVLLIIIVLVGLLVPALGRARQAARRTNAVTQLSQISAAVVNWKMATHTQHIPCVGSGPAGEFRVRGTYYAVPTGTQVGLNSAEFLYLKWVFPYLQPDGAGNYQTGLPDADLDANQTLCFFLTGGNYADSNPKHFGRVAFRGFCTDKAKPFQAPAVTGSDNRLGPFLEITATNVDDINADFPHLVDPWGTPYAFFNWEPGTNNYPTTAKFTWTNPDGVQSTAVPLIDRATSKYYQPKGFQLISAGHDQRFGAMPYPPTITAMGVWTPGEGDWSEKGPGGDDLSNFNAGPLVAQN